jgi:hypothetical protein
MRKNNLYCCYLIGRLSLITIIQSTLNFSFTQINISAINKKLLEHEIKVLVDSTRLANKLPSLFNDSILYVASNHHANYLLSKGLLSHEETEKKEFFSPQDRAKYYGAPKSYLVGENIAYTLYNSAVRVKGKTFQTNDYKEIARSLVFSWINSKGHFSNIINPDYQVTGISIAVDTKEHRIYACQKFAQVVFKYTFEENKEFFPYSGISQDSINVISAKIPKDLSYPFGLRYDKRQKCDECKDAWNDYPIMSVRISHNYFILRVEDADFVKQLIENKHDGFAIEIVPFDPFACGNPMYESEPSRRNGMKRTSGLLLEPVYRNELMKGFKKRKRIKNLSFVKYLFKADSISFFNRFGRYKLVNFEAKYFEIKLGKVPKNMNTWWNHNLMYIHNKQICHVVYLTNYMGEIDLELIDIPYYPPIPVNDYNFKLEYFKDTVELFYKPGETVNAGRELDAIVSKYKEKNLTINKIRIEGFCSVEGDAATNEMLHMKRAEKILEQLKSITSSDSVYQINSQVAWDHFYSSVKNHPKWNFLYSMSRNEVVQYLTDSKNERPLEILSQERKVNVEINGVRELSPINSNYYVQRDLKNLFFKDKKGVLQCSNTDTLQKLYEKAFYFTTVDTMKVSDFLKIEIPKVINLNPHPLEHDIAFYRYHYLKDTANKEELAKLVSKVEAVFKMCGAAEHLSPEFHYLSACLLVDRIKQKKGNNTIANPDNQKAFDRLNLLLTSYILDSSFQLDVAKANLNIIYILCESIDPDLLFEYNDIVNKSLIHIVEYYRKTNQLNPKSVLSLSKLACYFQNIPLALDLCEDYLYDDDILKLYLPLLYNHSSYLTNDDGIEFEVNFQNLLIEAKNRLSSDDWCKLFYGEYGIPFQVMDNKRLHMEFCATCPNRVNQVLEEQ